MSPTIEAHGLTKHYGEVHALDGLDLTAESGRLTALLGPNGAGKTTFISAVATLLRPSSGTLTWPASTLRPTPRRSARSSASPASTPRSNRP